jgi:hypothetical protein
MPEIERPGSDSPGLSSPEPKNSSPAAARTPIPQEGACNPEAAPEHACNTPGLPDPSEALSRSARR